MYTSRGYNGRGRGGGGFSSYRGRGGSTAYRPPSTPGKSILDGLGARVVDTLDIRSLRFVGSAERAGLVTPASTISEDIKIQDYRCIGSYSWKDSPSPTILVPGSPRHWHGSPTPFSIKTDGELFGSKLTFVDQNSYRMPDSPLLPLITAVDHMNASEPFDWGSVDFVTDRNGLRKLIRWLERSEKLTDFRIDVQLAGDRTVLFSRWEPRSTDTAFPGSYGFSFEKSQTRPAPGCEDATGHHRIVTYNFDGLRMVVRFEVDACFPPSPTSKDTSNSTSQTVVSGDDVDDLAALLSGTKITDTSSSKPSRTTSGSAGLKLTEGSSGLIVRSVGTLVSQNNIIELTTRSVRNAATFSWPEAFPQLWLSQTPYHFLAVHERGTFTSVTRRLIDGTELRGVAADAQASFKKLRRVLGAIRELIIERGRDARLSLVCRNGMLEIFERTGGESLLPKELIKRFDL